jgi:hypothetical protein
MIQRPHEIMDEIAALDAGERRSSGGDSGVAVTDDWNVQKLSELCEFGNGDRGDQLFCLRGSLRKVAPVNNLDEVLLLHCWSLYFLYRKSMCKAAL